MLFVEQLYRNPVITCAAELFYANAGIENVND